jgi:hypothetical protein
LTANILTLPILSLEPSEIDAQPTHMDNFNQHIACSLPKNNAFDHKDTIEDVLNYDTTGISPIKMTTGSAVCNYKNSTVASTIN